LHDKIIEKREYNEKQKNKDQERSWFMRPKNFDINLLLLCLLLFSLIIGITYTKKSQGITNNRNSLISIEEESIALLHPLIISVSMEKIVDLMKCFSPDTSYNIAKHIIGDIQSTLSKRDKQQLIFGLAQAFSQDSSVQHKFLSLLFELDENSDGPTLLFNCVKDGYEKLVPDFIKWARSSQQEHPTLKDVEHKVLYFAINHNDIPVLEKLHKNGIQINPKQASDLLWHVVFFNKDAQFIPFCAQRGADLSIHKEGHTLVTKATQQNNLAIVQALVEALKNKGKTVKEIERYINRFVDPAIGSPIQIALEKEYADLEIYLRKHGAIEK